MICGKAAAAKSTLAARLGDAPGTILISKDAVAPTAVEGFDMAVYREAS